MGFRDTSKGRLERIAAAVDQQEALKIDNAQDRALKRLQNELEMIKTSIQTQAQQQQQRIIEKRGNA